MQDQENGLEPLAFLIGALGLRNRDIVLMSEIQLQLHIVYGIGTTLGKMSQRGNGECLSPTTRPPHGLTCTDPDSNEVAKIRAISIYKSHQ